MRSPKDPAILLLLASLYLSAGYCQDVWEVFPEGGEDQVGLPGGVLGEPPSLQNQSGIDYLPQSGNEILPPPAMAPTEIRSFDGPRVAKPGEKVTLTWDVLNDCGVFLDNIPVESKGSYTYTVPLVGAPDGICHKLKAYQTPCDNPIPILPIYKDLCIQIQRLAAPDAPTEFNFTGWTKTSNGLIANFKWKDSSNIESGFKIYNGMDLAGSCGPDVTTIGIPIQCSRGKSLTFHVVAFNDVGESAPSNSMHIEGFCPPNTEWENVEIRKVEIYDSSENKYTYWVDSAYTGPWGYGPFWVDIHVITQSPTGRNLTEDVYRDLPTGKRVEVKPNCFADLKVYAIPKNAAGEGNPTNSIAIRRFSVDPECTLDPTQNLEYTNTRYQFSLGSSMGDSKEYYFAVYRPGPISVKATWAGTATDLDLALEGPGSDGWNTDGTSPLRLGHLVTLEDLAKGYTWKISVIKHAAGGAAQGTIDLSYPKGCCFAGTWDTNLGRMNLELLGDGQTVDGDYDHDDGIIKGAIEVAKIEGNKLVGEWKESPTYKAPKDAGDAELYMSSDCKSFIGYWKYGYSGDWDGDWEGTRVDGKLALKPRGGGGM